MTTGKDLKDTAQTTGKLMQVVLAVFTFLEKVTVPLLMLLTQRAKQAQRKAEDQVAVYQTKEAVNEASKAVDEANAGKPPRRVILDFLRRNGGGS